MGGKRCFIGLRFNEFLNIIFCSDYWKITATACYCHNKLVKNPHLILFCGYIYYVTKFQKKFSRAC